MERTFLTLVSNMSKGHFFHQNPQLRGTVPSRRQEEESVDIVEDKIQEKLLFTRWNEMSRDMTKHQQSDRAPSEDSDQPGHPPSLNWVLAVSMKKAWVLSYPWRAQQRLWSDWADAQADLSLRWAHSHFVGFVMSRLKCRLDLIM